MEFRVNCLTSVVIFCAIVNANARHLHHERKHEYISHKISVQKFQRESMCSVPKETIVQLNEITFNKTILTHQKISPPVTVLHRCETCSACSKPGYTCTAKDSTIVSQTFSLNSVDSSQDSSQEHAEYIIGTAVNHTSCWCQPTTSQPK